MGGDHGLSVIVDGALRAARQWRMNIVLVGDAGLVQAELAGHDCTGLSIAVEHASEVVGMHDSASDAIRKKRIRQFESLLNSSRVDVLMLLSAPAIPVRQWLPACLF